MELQNMNKYDLRSICRELGIYCDKNKSNIIKKLLNPLKSKYKMDPRSKKEKDSCEYYKEMKDGTILEFYVKNINATPSELKEIVKKFSEPITAAYLDKQKIINIVKSKIMNGTVYKNWWKKDKELRVLFGKLLQSIKKYGKKDHETCVKFENRIYKAFPPEKRK